MPKKRTRMKKSTRTSQRSKATPISDELLAASLNERIVVDTAKKTYEGQLIRYDTGSIVISPKTCVRRDDIIAFFEEKNAPHKNTAGSPVR
jgi:hypothetical protein